ncbi:uncharacterized protein LOC125665706 [Ostrea edulis]|uniref:uncharacterized protein LOC125665706 n=1 Tax=Ostrea edulis TaxID=37623 RepID=UPI0024AEA2ED|nr:uncharacterized protein LOC125665706 [Ostrea edulis]
MQMYDTKPPEVKDALRRRRNDSLSLYLKHSLVCGVLSFIGVAVGIANIVVGVDDGPWHLTGGSLIPGIFSCICALLGYKLYQTGWAEQGDVDAGIKAKCFFIAHYVLNLLTTIISLAFVALSIVGIVWCSGEVQHYYVRINRVQYQKNVTCPEDRTAALVTGGLAAFDSFLIVVWCFLGTVFFCCYVRAFGFENRRRNNCC